MSCFHLFPPKGCPYTWLTGSRICGQSRLATLGRATNIIIQARIHFSEITAGRLRSSFSSSSQGTLERTNELAVNVEEEDEVESFNMDGKAETATYDAQIAKRLPKWSLQPQDSDPYSAIISTRNSAAPLTEQYEHHWPT